jgi:hypothetical protein
MNIEDGTLAKSERYRANIEFVKHQGTVNVVGCTVVCRPSLLRGVSDISIDSEISEDETVDRHEKKIRRGTLALSSHNAEDNKHNYKGSASKLNSNDVIDMTSISRRQSFERNYWITPGVKLEVSLHLPQRSRSWRRYPSLSSSSSTLVGCENELRTQCPVNEEPEFSWVSTEFNDVVYRNAKRDSVPQVPMRRMSLLSGR